MNNYSKLLHSNVISLGDVLIENYKVLGLDETHVTLLLLLNLQKNQKDNFLSTNVLAEKMTIGEKEISERILFLLQKNFIELKIEEVGEMFVLDPLIEKLADLLAKGEEKTIDNSSALVTEIVDYCEKTYQRILSIEDLKIINMWVEEEYSLEEIKSAVLDSLKAKKAQLRYADAVIINRRNNLSREKVEVDPELQAVLSSINVKRNY